MNQHVGSCTGQLVSDAYKFGASKLRADVAKRLAADADDVAALEQVEQRGKKK